MTSQERGAIRRSLEKRRERQGPKEATSVRPDYVPHQGYFAYTGLVIYVVLVGLAYLSAWSSS